MNEFHEEDEDFFCRFSFGQFVSLAVLELVALFFVFYLGARYGPSLLGMNPPRAEQRLAQMPLEGGNYQYRERGSDAVEYTYPETLTRNPQQAPVMRRGEAPAVQPPPQPRQQVAARQPIKSTPSVPVVRGGYAVQVGSFKQAGGAAEKVNEWQAKGYDAFLSIGEVPRQGTVYRVRIGSFPSRNRARQFLEDLVNREKVSAIIVRSNS